MVSSSLLKDTTITFAHESKTEKKKKITSNIFLEEEQQPPPPPPSSSKSTLILEDDDIKQSRTDSTPPAQIIIITSDRSQQTSVLDMPLNLDDDNDDTTIVSERNPRSQISRTLPHHRNHSENRHSQNSDFKPSSSEEQTSTVPVDEDEREEQSPPNQLKSILTVPAIHTINRVKPIPVIKQSITKPTSTATSLVTKKSKSSSLKWSSSLNTRTYLSQSISRQ